MNDGSKIGIARRRRAFTLIELLIVVAIIAILVTMLMPQVSKMMGEARFLGCMNNLRQVMNASIMYAAANQGSMPSPNWGAADVTQRGWLYSKNEMDKREHLRAGQLWAYLGDTKLYRCPSDPEPDESNPSAVPNRPNNSQMITSYTMNGSVCRFGNRPKVTEPVSGCKIWVTHKVSEFKSDAVLYWEPDDTVLVAGWWYDGSNYPNQGVATNRHARRAAVACAGGTVERIDVPEYYRMANSNTFNRVRNSPNAINGLN